MMLRSTFALATAGLASLAGGARAGAPASTPVAEVTVPGGPAPKVTASYPADGATVPAGTLVLKVTFDLPMTPDNWSYSRAPDAGFPNCLERPRLLADRKTFVLLCAVGAHQDYAIQINTPKDFAADSGRSAKPTLLRFSTTDVGPRDIHDALAEAGLTDQDDPVMTWKDGGAGISQAGPSQTETASTAPTPTATNRAR
jgi:hypothetical protein